VRAAPALFSDLSITFRANTFTKPAKLAALDRLGFYVKRLNFKLPHSPETILPPLIDPDTGSELSFSYTPQTEASTVHRPKYGDLGTTEILTRQWPTLFHAATNVPAFIRVFSAFVNLSHLKISCPNYDNTARHQRSIVDYALISVRIAVERTCLNGLESLSLSPIHPGGLLYLSPVLGYGSTPRSASRWKRIKRLSISTHALPPPQSPGEPDHFKLLQTYIRNFQSNITAFKFSWLGDKGALPVKQPVVELMPTSDHPLFASRDGSQPPRARKCSQPIYFPKLERATIENCKSSSEDIRVFAGMHKRTLADLDLDDIQLTSGTWDDALAPLTHLNPKPRRSEDLANIPIMFSPTAAAIPVPMDRVEVAHTDANGRKSLRMSRWLSTKSKSKTPRTSQRMREGLMGCEEQLRKVLKGSMFPRR